MYEPLWTVRVHYDKLARPEGGKKDEIGLHASKTRTKTSAKIMMTGVRPNEENGVKAN